VKWLNSNRIWWGASIAAALAAPPLLLRAEPEGFDVKRSRVSAMPQTERDRLTRNFEDYLKLTDDQRTHYRRLHEGLQQDRAENAGRCAAAMDAYYAWVSTLPAYQQQSLLTTTDPAGRIRLVAQYVDEQELRQMEEEQRKMGPRGGNFFRLPRLSSSELAAVMAELERAVTLSPEQRQRLDEKPDGIERYLELFKIVGAERKLKITDVITDVRAEQLLEKLPQRARDRLVRPTRPERTFSLIRTITWNLWMEIESQSRARQPDPDKLLDFVKQWPADQSAELDELMDLSPDDFVQRVREKYAAQNLALDFEHIRRTYPPEWISPRGGQGSGSRGGSGFPRSSSDDREQTRDPQSSD
jgi:hypothetical protein